VEVLVETLALQVRLTLAVVVVVETATPTAETVALELYFFATRQLLTSQLEQDCLALQLLSALTR
jgi:hypothetical protein